MYPFLYFHNFTILIGKNMIRSKLCRKKFKTGNYKKAKIWRNFHFQNCVSEERTKFFISLLLDFGGRFIISHEVGLKSLIKKNPTFFEKNGMLLTFFWVTHIPSFWHGAKGSPIGLTKWGKQQTRANSGQCSKTTLYEVLTAAIAKV